MNVSLLLPFASMDPRRIQIYAWVLARWMTLFPEWQICIGVDDPENFNRSRARNNAFMKADGDILVITDADTATTPGNVTQAIETVKRTRGWVIAHQTYYSLNETYTDYLLERPPNVGLEAGLSSSKYNWVMNSRSEAGVLVMPREAYETVEGYDERFQDWGYEDNAFATKLRQKWGEPQRTTGSVIHLWHDPGLNFDQPHIKENEALLEEIRREL